MFNAYYSNRLETLAEILAGTLSEPQANPLAPEVVIVQNHGMARWLSMDLADRLGVCANLRFVFPAEFVWEMYRLLLDEVPETSAFDRPVLVWRVLALLDELGEDPCYEPLRHYLRTDDDLRRFELARRIAYCYDQYLLYRPDWIEHWQNGGDGHWQAALWRRLTERDQTHRVSMQRDFYYALQSAEASSLLPERVSVFGISALPANQLDAFAALGERIDAHLLLLNPCREYWGDIVANRDLARRDPGLEAEEHYLHVGNPLLASLGKQGRDFLDLVLEKGVSEDYEHYDEPGQDSLLACLQTDILNLQRRGDDPADDLPPSHVQLDDRSLQVHACHSPLREAEVLHDQLLALFEAYPGLRPSDVVVMTPDIDAYGPIIEAVFATVEDRRHIPFSIADRGLGREKPLLEVFMALLDLPRSRFDAARVLALLEAAAVRRRFGIDDRDLGRIQSWVGATGIRWGVDAAHRAEWDLPATREHTWQTGRERLLLGYALPGGGQRLWRDTLPYDQVEGSDAQLMGHLQHFLQTLIELRRALSQPQPMITWSSLLSDWLERFFDPPDAEEEQLQILRNAFSRLIDHAALADFTAAVPLAVVQAWLRRELEIGAGSSGFFSGGVTFCTMVPMRSIPFQVVCLIGMNSDSYPRPQRAADFDLLAADFRKGDRSRRQDDRYLFLEALVSARRCLYISYVGNDIRDNSVLPPSVLVSELLDLIDQGFRSPLGDIRDHVLTRHPLQAFSPRYFGADPRLFSYSQELAETSRHAAGQRGEARPFIDRPLPEADDGWRRLELTRLGEFFVHPARFFLRERLGIYLSANGATLEHREPFVLDGLDSYRLRRILLPLQQRGAEHALALARAAGALPHGRIGSCQFEREWDVTQRLRLRLRRLLGESEAATVDVDLELAGFRIYGRLPEVYPCGQVGYRPAQISAKDRLQLWLRHLLLNAARPGSSSLWLGLDGECALRPVERPEFYLAQLLEYYWQGLRQPLAFFPRSAFEYVSVYRDKKAKRDPERAARSAWEGSEYGKEGEGQDPYHRLAFRACDPLNEAFYTLALRIVRPILDHSREP